MRAQEKVLGYSRVGVPRIEGPKIKALEVEINRAKDTFASIDRTLEKFGFGGYKRRIYISALRFGKATVSELAKDAAVPLPKAYEVVNELEAEGFLSRILITPKTYAPVQPATSLKSIMKTREEELRRIKDMLRLLPQVKAPKNEVVEISVMQGKTAVRQYLADYLTTNTKKSFVTCISFRSPNTSMIPALREKLKREKVNARIIGPEGCDKRIALKYKQAGARIRLVKDLLPQIRFSVYDNTLASFTLINTNSPDQEPYTTLFIRSGFFAKLFTDLFNYYWSKGKDL